MEGSVWQRVQAWWQGDTLTDTQVQALQDHAAMQEDEGQVFGSTFEQDRWRYGREDMPPVAFVKTMVNDAINMGEVTEAQRSAVESRMAADYLRDAPEAYRGALTLLATQDERTLDLFQPNQLPLPLPERGTEAYVQYVLKDAIQTGIDEGYPIRDPRALEQRIRQEEGLGESTTVWQALDRMAERTQPHAWIAAEAARLRAEQGSSEVVQAVAQKGVSFGR